MQSLQNEVISLCPRCILWTGHLQEVRYRGKSIWEEDVGKISPTSSRFGRHLESREPWLWSSTPEMSPASSRSLISLRPTSR